MFGVRDFINIEFVNEFSYYNNDFVIQTLQCTHFLRTKLEYLFQFVYNHRLQQKINKFNYIVVPHKRLLFVITCS